MTSLELQSLPLSLPYGIYRDTLKAKQERRKRLADLYGTVSACMGSLAFSLQQGKMSVQRSAEFTIYILEFDRLVERYRARKLPTIIMFPWVAVRAILRRRKIIGEVVSSKAMTKLQQEFSTSTFLEAASDFILYVMDHEQVTPEDHEKFATCASKLGKAAGEFAAWAALLRA